MAEPYSVDQLPQVWQQRFAFFEAYGLPGSSSQSQAAFKALPFGTMLRLTTNLLAFFFGPIYHFVKGMWRKGLVLLAEAIGIGVLVAFNGPDMPTICTPPRAADRSTRSKVSAVDHRRHSRWWTSP